MSSPSHIEPLERIADHPNGIAVRFRNMPEADFEKVCAAAIINAMAQEQLDNGCISLRSVTIMVNAMRDRYKSIVNTSRKSPRDKTAGEGNHNAELNEMQVRIIRRVEFSRKRHISFDGVAKMLGVKAGTVHKAYHGVTWKNLKQRGRE